MTDVLENGWKEVNENAKNIIQDQVMRILKFINNCLGNLLEFLIL